MAHAHKADFVFRRNGRVHLNRQGHQFSQLLAAELVRISGSNAGYTTFRGSVRVLATHSIRQFPLHFPSLASPCAIRFQMHYTISGLMLQNLGDQIHIKLLNDHQSVWSVMYTSICTEWNYNFICKLQPCYVFQQ